MIYWIIGGALLGGAAQIIYTIGYCHGVDSTIRRALGQESR